MSEDSEYVADGWDLAWLYRDRYVGVSCLPNFFDQTVRRRAKGKYAIWIEHEPYVFRRRNLVYGDVAEEELARVRRRIIKRAGRYKGFLESWGDFVKERKETVRNGRWTHGVPMNKFGEWYMRILESFPAEQLWPVRFFEMYLHSEITQTDMDSFFEDWSQGQFEEREVGFRLIGFHYKYPMLWIAVLLEGQSTQYLRMFDSMRCVWMQKVVWWTEVSPAPEGMTRSMSHWELLDRLVSDEGIGGGEWSIVVVTWYIWRNGDSDKKGSEFRQVFMDKWKRIYNRSLTGRDVETRMVSFPNIDVCFSRGDPLSFDDLQMLLGNVLLEIRDVYCRKNNMDFKDDLYEIDWFMPSNLAIYTSATCKNSSVSIPRALYGLVTELRDPLFVKSPREMDRQERRMFLHEYGKFIRYPVYEMFISGGDWMEWQSLVLSDADAEGLLQNRMTPKGGRGRRVLNNKVFRERQDRIDQYQFREAGESWWNVEKPWDSIWPDYTGEERKGRALYDGEPVSASGVTGDDWWLMNYRNLAKRGFCDIGGARFRVAKPRRNGFCRFKGRMGNSGVFRFGSRKRNE